MATQKQIEANRRNAQRSTGPVTELGKGVAKFNALKHGMTASTAVLPYEDPSSYAELRESFVATYRPANAVEASLVEVVANSYWRLLRARRAETATMTLGIQSLKTRHDVSIHPRQDDDMALAVFLSGQRRHPSSNGALPRQDRAVLLQRHRNAPQSPEGTASRRAPHHRAAQANWLRFANGSRIRSERQSEGGRRLRHARSGPENHTYRVPGRQCFSRTAGNA